LHRCLGAAERGCDDTVLVLRAIGRDIVTYLALAGASGVHPGWPVQPASDAPRPTPRRTERR
jgi:hypothetical protein